MNAIADLIQLVVEAHMLVAAVTVCKTSSVDNKPCASFFPDHASDPSPEQRQKVLLLAVDSTVVLHLHQRVPGLSDLRERLRLVHLGHQNRPLVLLVGPQCGYKNQKEVLPTLKISISSDGMAKLHTEQPKRTI